MAFLGTEALHYIGATHRAVGMGDDIGRLVKYQAIWTIDDNTVNTGYVELDGVASAIYSVHDNAKLGT